MKKFVVGLSLIVLAVVVVAKGQVQAPQAQNPAGKKIAQDALGTEERTLVDHALAACDLAYCPYSKSAVGACLVAENAFGRRQYFSGARVENASEKLSICAERVAVFRAVSEGYKKILTLAISAKTPGGSPCGACRQVIKEFGKDATILFFADKDKEKVVLKWKLGELPEEEP